jgi:hypothetical protein
MGFLNGETNKGYNFLGYVATFCPTKKTEQRLSSPARTPSLPQVKQNVMTFPHAKCHAPSPLRTFPAFQSTVKDWTAPPPLHAPHAPPDLFCIL